MKLEEGERDVKDVGAEGVCSLGASGLLALATLTTRHENLPPNSGKKLSQSHVTLCHVPFPKTVLTALFYCMEAMSGDNDDDTTLRVSLYSLYFTALP